MSSPFSVAQRWHGRSVRSRSSRSGCGRCKNRRREKFMAFLSRMRPPFEAASSSCETAIYCHALDSEGAEFGVLITNLACFLVLWGIAPSLHLFQAVPGVDGNAGLGRLAFDRRDLLGCAEHATASRFDRGPNFRDVLLRVRVDIRYVDFRDQIHGGLGLSVKALNSCGAKGRPRKH